MTRFGVMKHLRVLEEAGLVVTRRSGREKLHFLNPVPIRLIHDRWIDKYTERRVVGARRPQDRTGGDRMSTIDRHRPRQVYQVFIKATPGADLGRDHHARVHARYFYGARIETHGRAAPLRSRPDGDVWGDVADASSTTRRAGWCTSWRSLYDPELAAEEAEPRELGDRAPGRRLLQADRRSTTGSRARRRPPRASPARAG